MWVNGYVHRKAGNPRQGACQMRQIADYCKKNPDATVADAIEALAKS